jgi:photosystem II stability/assembly factor-like uncharacterized protein
VKPGNNNHIIVANQFGGLWKTENGGTNWYHIEGLPAVFAVDVAYAADGNTVIATLARDNRRDNGGGIWVSRDAGSNWAKPATANPPTSPRVPDRISAYGISYAPDNPEQVYVGTDYGIAVSADNGRTWSHYMVQDTSPIDTDRMQNSVFSLLALPANKAIALCRNGVFLTADRGETWRNIRPGNFAFSSPLGFKNVDVSPLDSNHVFILQDYSNLLFYELNSSAWTTIPLPGGRSRGPFVRISRSSLGTTSIDIWVGAGVNLLKTTCTGLDAIRRITAADWISLHRAAGLHDDSGYLGLDNTKLPILYGSDGGLFKPTNPEATTWTRAAIDDSGLNSYQITDLAGTNIGPLRPRFRIGPLRFWYRRYRASLYITTQDNAIWASADDGLTWPNSDCAEGFHVEVRKDAPSNAGVTVAYGKVGCGPSPSMFSDANLENQRAVPDIDVSGAALSNMSQAFLISPGNWIRYRTPARAISEIYLSTNNGLNWRRKASIALAPKGVFAVSGPSTNPTIYAPFQGARTRPDGGERIGLMEFTDVFSPAVVNYDDRDLIYLPNDGSLGLRATEFDWQAVYGVDPMDPGYIIAPDIQNQVVKVTRTGGYDWVTDENLTSAVTGGGQFMLYDQDPYHMQVTHISFDPYYPNRIFVGTRDAGVILSEDGGRTWNVIPGSEGMLYVTGFFIKRDHTVIVSTYGRGLWSIDFNVFLASFPLGFYCSGLGCLIRLPIDPEILRDPMDWLDKDVSIFLNGRINGLVLSGSQVKEITVTPGSLFRRYVAGHKDFPALNIVESEKGAGFKGLKGCQAALDNGEVITGVIMKAGEIIAILSGTEEFKDPESRRKPKDDNSMEDPEAKQPYLFITTSISMPGLPVVGSDGVVTIFATGFRFSAEGEQYANVLLDGEMIAKDAKVSQDGSLEYEFKVSEELAHGQHTVQVIQQADNKELSASSSFVKATIDDFDEEKREKEK